MSAVRCLQPSTAAPWRCGLSSTDLLFSAVRHMAVCSSMNGRPLASPLLCVVSSLILLCTVLLFERAGCAHACAAGARWWALLSVPVAVGRQCCWVSSDPFPSFCSCLLQRACLTHPSPQQQRYDAGRLHEQRRSNSRCRRRASVVVQAVLLLSSPPTAAILPCSEDKSACSMCAHTLLACTACHGPARWPRRCHSSAASKAFPSSLAATCATCSLLPTCSVPCTPHAWQSI